MTRGGVDCRIFEGLSQVLPDFPKKYLLDHSGR